MSDEQEFGPKLKVQDVKQTQLIYCGPTLPVKYALTQYQIFINGLPAHVEKLVAEHPVISTLLIPVNELAQVRMSLANAGSVEANMYKAIQNNFRKE